MRKALDLSATLHAERQRVAPEPRGRQSNRQIARGQTIALVDQRMDHLKEQLRILGEMARPIEDELKRLERERYRYVDQGEHERPILLAKQSA